MQEMKKTVQTITLSAAMLGTVMAPIEMGAGNQNGGEAKKKNLILGGTALVAGGLTLAYANQNAITNWWYGDFALHDAAIKGDLELIKYLVAHGANVNRWTKHGSTPLLEAAAYGHLVIVKYLVDHGANVHIPGRYGLTPLHWACIEDHLEIVEYLIEHGGAKVDERADKGYNAPLQSAVDHRKLRIVKYLVEHGANVNAIPTKSGEVAILTAAKNGYLEIVKYLVGQGANVSINDTSTIVGLGGITAIVDFGTITARAKAEAAGHQEVAAYLALVEDFQPLFNKPMEFNAFIKKYFEVQDQKVKKEHIDDVRNILHLGTKQLAEQFYDWLKKDGAFATGDSWVKGTGFMYFDLFKKTLARDKRLLWYSNAAECATANNDLKLQDELKWERNKPGNTKLKTDFELQQGMLNIASKKLVPEKILCTKKNLYDCKIFFKK